MFLIIRRNVSRYYEKYSRNYDFFLVITRNVSRYYEFCFS